MGTEAGILDLFFWLTTFFLQDLSQCIDSEYLVIILYAASPLRLCVVLVFNRLALNVLSSSAMKKVRDKSDSAEPQERETEKGQKKVQTSLRLPGLLQQDSYSFTAFYSSGTSFLFRGKISRFITWNAIKIFNGILNEPIYMVAFYNTTRYGCVGWTREISQKCTLLQTN